MGCKRTFRRRETAGWGVVLPSTCVMPTISPCLSLRKSSGWRSKWDFNHDGETVKGFSDAFSCSKDNSPVTARNTTKSWPCWSFGETLRTSRFWKSANVPASFKSMRSSAIPSHFCPRAGLPSITTSYLPALRLQNLCQSSHLASSIIYLLCENPDEQNDP